MNSSQRFTIWLKQRHPAFWLVILGGIFGLALVVLVPPFEVPDEQRHLFRVYHLSTGHLWAEEGPRHTAYVTIPASLKDLADRQSRGDFIPGPPQDYSLSRFGHYFQQPLKPAQTDKGYVASIGTYSPVGYVPQAVAVGLGRLVEAPAIILLYLARLANLAVWLALGYAAVRLVPFGRWQAVGLYLLPMAIFEAASAAADGLLIGVSYLFVALLLRYHLSPRPLTSRQRFGLLVLASGIALIKPTYGLLPFVALTLPAGRFGGRKLKLRFAGWLGLVTLAPIGLWQATTTHMANITYGLGIQPEPMKQLMYGLAHPLQAAGAWLATLLGNTSDGLVVSFAGSFGWLDFRLPVWAVVAVVVILLLALAVPGTQKLEFPRFTRLITALLLGTSFLGISIVLYLTYNPVGAPVVAGLQGRYLLPFVPFLFLVRSTRPSGYARPIMALSMLLLAATVVRVSVFYYGG